jgi:predicted Fe-Mo cluster-binding NifX family protein
MKVAIPVCVERVATTIDFARELLVVDCVGSRQVRRDRIVLEEMLPANRARRIIGLGIDVLICGAVSRPLARLIQDSGIQVIPLVSGSVDDVLAAFLADRLDESSFLLPGCTADDRRRLVHSHAEPKAR